MYLANPTLNGRYKKTFVLKIDAVNYLEKMTGYEMDKETEFKGSDLIFNTDIEGVVFTPGPMIRAEFATYDWEIVGKLEEI